MNANGDGGTDFDELLERELRLRVGSLRGPSPDVRQAAYRAVATGGRTAMPMLSTLAATMTTKVAAGLATAAVVVGGGSAAAAAAVTHSANPVTWGRTITETVAACKSQLAEGQHGIGQCVSAVARQHGQEQRDAHSAASDHGQQPDASASPHPNGPPASHPTGPPSPHPTGPPSPHPTGPPSSHPDKPTPKPHPSENP